MGMEGEMHILFRHNRQLAYTPFLQLLILVHYIIVMTGARFGPHIVLFSFAEGQAPSTRLHCHSCTVYQRLPLS